MKGNLLKSAKVFGFGLVTMGFLSSCDEPNRGLLPYSETAAYDAVKSIQFGDFKLIKDLLKPDSEAATNYSKDEDLTTLREALAEKFKGSDGWGIYANDYYPDQFVVKSAYDTGSDLKVVWTVTRTLDVFATVMQPDPKNGKKQVKNKRSWVCRITVTGERYSRRYTSQNQSYSDAAESPGWKITKIEIK